VKFLSNGDPPRRRRRLEAEVDGEGRLVLPAEFAREMGLEPGARVPMTDEPDALRLYRPLTHLAKVYVEPTSRCNLGCRTCMRHAWDEPAGDMDDATFERVLRGLAQVDPTPTLFLGGFGEPLSHPAIVDMVAAGRAVGAPVELITNGTLLDEATSRRLVDAGLSRLWVSLDGARPESYEDVRLGAELAQVLENLRRFRQIDPPGGRPALGIAFVAMRRNIADLPALVDLVEELEGSRLMVSNLVPHTEAMVEDILYQRSLADPTLFAPFRQRLELPLMDVDSDTGPALMAALRREPNVTVAGRDVADGGNHCPFIERGSLTVAWDGSVSPCLPLSHSYTAYLNRFRREWRRHVVGTLAERPLLEIWRDPEYLAFRERVSRFDFSPCVSCGACHLAETNEDDCFGSGTPSCGGCPWARGVVQCP